MTQHLLLALAETKSSSETTSGQWNRAIQTETSVLDSDGVREWNLEKGGGGKEGEAEREGQRGW